MTRLGKAKLKCFRHPRKRFTWYEYNNGDQYMECNKCHLRIEFDFAGKVTIYDAGNILSTWTPAERYFHYIDIINERGFNKVVTHQSDHKSVYQFYPGQQQEETDEPQEKTQIFPQGDKLADKAP